MSELFNRTVFFDSVRPMFGNKLTQQQVDGMNALLDQWEAQGGGDPRHLAYMLATTKWETAHLMWPITEMGSQSYLEGKSYYPYIGRGFVQLTWLDNYRRATEKLGLTGEDDLVDYPDRALDLVIASNVMFRGMAEGWFTGKYLDQYFSETEDDPKNARQIINGNDKDDEIAAIHDDFLDALTLAQEATEPPDETGEEDNEHSPPEGEPVVISMTVPQGVMLIVNGEEVITA